MKRCPKCQRTFTDETLRFCLEDGTALLSDVSRDIDRKVLDRAEDSREPPPTEILDPALAPTLRAREPQTTLRLEGLAQGKPQHFAAPAPGKRSTTSVAALTVVATILVLGLTGLGAWLMLKDNKGSERNGSSNPGTETRGVSANSNAFPPTGNAETFPGSVGSTPLPTATPLATPTATPPKVGYIKGNMTYPSDGIPGVMVVCAENVETKDTVCSPRRKNWETNIGYSLPLSSGRYYVYGTLLPGDESVEGMRGVKAYYTDYIKCGMGANCKSHKRIAVEVIAGETLTGITAGDWWANL